MADSSAIGFSLNIPDTFFDKIKEAESRINDLENVADKQAKNINNHFRSLAASGSGLDEFIRKLQEAKNAMADVGVINPNMSKQFAEALVQAAGAINNIDSTNIDRANQSFAQFVAYWEKIQNNPKLAKQLAANDVVAELNKLKEQYNVLKEQQRELMRIEEDRANREKVNKQKRTSSTQREIADIRLTTAEYRNYTRAMAMSEQTILSRTKKLERLRSVQAELSRSNQNYSTEISNIKNKMQELTNENKRVEQSTNNIRKSHRSLINTADQLKRSFALLFSVSQIKGYVMNLVKVRGEFELQNRALQAILQNKDEADKLFGQITELAVKSPFQLKELVTYTKQLAAYRVESEKLYDTTKQLADVSAGLGVDMQRLILAYGQVKAANYLRGTELRQFSEAGINILGELSQYFTELEGRAVSVGDVFERVSKRMVSFADVEEIFQRITSEGGIFYNMQEIQAQTLEGMRSNLKDAIDIMLNDIGIAHEGTLKGTIETLRDLVENWREVAYMIKGVVIALSPYLAYMALARIANSNLSKTIGNTVLKMGKFGLWVDKNALSLEIWATKSKAASIATTALKGVLGGLTSAFTIAIPALAITLIVNWIRRATEASRAAKRLKKDLDNIINTDITNVSKSAESFDKLVDQLERAEIGSKNYREAMSKINNTYGEHLSFIVDETTELGKLREAYDDVTASMKQQASVQTYQKGVQRIEQNYADEITESRKKLEEQIKLYTNLTDSDVSIVLGRLQAEIDKIEEIGGLDLGAEDKQKMLNSIIREYANVAGYAVRYTGTLGEYMNLLLSQKEEELKLQERINAQYGDEMMSREYNLKLQEAQRKKDEQIADIQNRRNEDYYEGMSKDEIQYLERQAIADIQQEYERNAVKIKYDFKISQAESAEAIKNLEELRDKELSKIGNWATPLTKSINDKIIENLSDSYQMFDIDKVLIKESEQSAGQDEIEKNTIAAYKAQKEIIEQQTRLKNVGLNIDEKLLENATKLAEMYKVRGEVMGLDMKAEDEKLRKESRYIKMLKDQAALIIKAGQEYEKLFPEHGSGTNIAVATAFADAFKALNMENIFGEMTFDPSGIIEGLDMLMNAAFNTLINEGKLTAEEAAKVLEPMKAKVYADVSLEDMEAARKEMQGMSDSLSSSLKLSMDLKDLGFSDALINDIISKSPEIQAEFRSLFPEDLYPNLSFADLSIDVVEQRIKELQDTLTDGTKNTDIFKKELEELDKLKFTHFYNTMKEYNELLKKSMNEQAAIMISTQKKISEVYSNDKFTPEQRDDIAKQLREEEKRQLAKLQFEEFKGSDVYVRMFSDLESVSSQALTTLKNNLIRVRDSIKENLSPTDLKTFQDQLNKIDDVLNNRTPFKAYKDSLAEIRKMEAQGITEDSLNEELFNLQETEWGYKNEIANLEAVINLKEQKVDLSTLDEETQKKYSSLLNQETPILREQLETAETNLEQTQNTTAELTKQVGEYEKNRAAAGALADRVGEIARLGSEGFGAMRDIMESLGVESDSSTMAMFDMSEALVQATLQGVQFQLQMEAAGVASNSALGVIGWIVIALQTVAKMIKLIVEAEDNRIKEQIEYELKQVEKLQKAYEKLEKTISSAFNHRELQQSWKEANQNIQDQIDSYEKAIALEESRKKASEEDMDSYKESIDDLRQQEAELQEQILSDLGGFGSAENMKSAAQEFADAWLDAYRETGDGLNALIDKWDEYFENIIAQQLMLKGMDKFLQPIMNMIDTALEDTMFTGNEMASIQEKINELMPQLNEYWKGIMDMFPTFGQGSGELSGLQKGIQSITETTAEALEALLNSVRFFVADSNTQLKTLVNSLIGAEGYPNPMLSELKKQTLILTAIRDSLSSVMSAGHPSGGFGIKVFA